MASESLIVRGQANLLKDVSGLENLERIRQLFDDFETKRDLSSSWAWLSAATACTFSSARKTSCFRCPVLH